MHTSPDRRQYLSHFCAPTRQSSAHDADGEAQIGGRGLGRCGQAVGAQSISLA
jgi:hypothetical protein